LAHGFLRCTSAKKKRSMTMAGKMGRSHGSLPAIH
jgi:hypothetical protein